MDDKVSFDADILPLFTQKDIQHMDPLRVHLNDYAYMSDPTNDHANATKTSAIQNPVPWLEATNGS